MDPYLKADGADNCYLLDMDCRHPTTSKIRGFGLLSNGWHYGEGESPSENVQESAVLLNEEAIRWGILETDAFPGINGEIAVTLYSGHWYAEFTVSSENFVSYTLERDDVEIEMEEGLSLKQAKSKICAFAQISQGGEIKDKRWNSFDFSILGITTEDRKDSRVSHLGPPAEIAAYPLSAGTASEKWADTCVNTFASTTPQWQESHRSTGSFPVKLSPAKSV